MKILPQSCTLFLLLSCASFASASHDDFSTSCAERRQAIVTQLEHAQSRGNVFKEAGLKRALTNLDANCSDEGLRNKLQQKIAEQQNEVREREADLQEAMAKGDAKKIAKRQAKLDEARGELAQLLKSQD